MTKFGLAISVFAFLIMTSCNNSSVKQSQSTNEKIPKATSVLNNETIVYKSENLVLHRLSQHVYQHVSFLNTKDFGRVPCNGMVVVNDHQAIIFDTPADNKSSGELIIYVTQNLGSKIIAVIPTHFHEDCVGGIESFMENHIPCYASGKTIELLKNKSNKYTSYMKAFNDSLSLDIGNEKVYATWFGEGHTKDNIVGYFPHDRVMFGGCLIKESGASKGYLGDANLSDWPLTVLKVKQKYPQAKIVIPGHGKSGSTALLDYTIELFR